MTLCHLLIHIYSLVTTVGKYYLLVAETAKSHGKGRKYTERQKKTGDKLQ
jgi:hypothetical protein